MPKLRKFPLAMAAVHVVLTSYVFYAADHFPNAGLMPLISYGVDFPLSILMHRFADIVFPKNYYFGIDMEYLIFLVAGSLWIYLVARVLQNVAIRIRRSA